MLFQKKMLILVGDGKGVVFIEKNGLGVKFALRTFDFPARENPKAGVITKSTVTVRDLPAVTNPSAVFYLDRVDIDDLHFAVFDTELLLYGTTAPKRMWESNIMGLFERHCRGVSSLRDELPSLPPLVEKPRVLPLPTGAGIVQTSDRLYGDEALAETNFYSELDIPSRMPAVDAFLDSPRLLNNIAPRIVPPPNVSAREFSARETTATSDSVGQSRVVSESIETDSATEHKAQAADSEPDGEERDTVFGDLEHDEETIAEPKETVEDRMEKTEYFPSNTEQGGTSFSDVASTGASESVEADTATATIEDGFSLPWEKTARWLKARATRSAAIKRERVTPITKSTDVPKLRELSFFERCRADIDKLFSAAKKDEQLAALLPDLEWVKVEFDGNTVSVGRSGSMVLCYAVAGMYEKISPLGREAQWLPKLKNAPTGKGYWLMFQDPVTGEIVG